MERIQAVIFDLDQTLLDRQASLLRFLEWQTTQMLNRELNDPASFIKRFIELDSHGEVWKDVVYSTLIREFDLHQRSVNELLSIYASDFWKFCVEKEGATEAITRLSKTHRLGLISNGISPFQERNFRALEFAPLFQSVIVSEAIGLRKPDPAIFHLGCSQLGVEPAKAIYVGDNPTADIDGAKNAGLLTVFIPSGHYPDCPMADATCVDWENLPEIVAMMA